MTNTLHSLPEGANKDKYRKAVSWNLIKALINLEEYQLLKQIIEPVLGFDRTDTLIGRIEHNTPGHGIRKDKLKNLLKSSSLPESKILDLFSYNAPKPFDQILAILIKNGEKNGVRLKILIKELGLNSRIAWTLISSVERIESVDRAEIGFCLFRILAINGLFEQIDKLLDDLLMVHPSSDREISRKFIKDCRVEETLKMNIKTNLDKEGIYLSSKHQRLRKAYIDFEFKLRCAIAVKRSEKSRNKSSDNITAALANAQRDLELLKMIWVEVSY